MAMNLDAYGSVWSSHEKTIRLIELSAPSLSSEIGVVDFSFGSTPQFISVTHSITHNHDSSLPNELRRLFSLIAEQSGIRHFWIKEICSTLASASDVFDKAVRNIVWLGPAVDDSEVAFRCIARLEQRPISIPVRKFWSQKEGRAILALSERAIWKDQHLAVDLAISHNVDFFCGDSQISWGAILQLRDILDVIVQEGRIEHHAFAHAILGSFASNVLLKAMAGGSVEDVSLPDLAQESDVWNDMSKLSSHLDLSISVVEDRWHALGEQSQIPAPVMPIMQSEADLDAEIARYTSLLQQIDLFEADLEHLDSVSSHLRSMQYQARSPRNSPEISP